ncbi:GDP-mannose 4,6-dehydratase [Sphingobium tyrosinilyticum]|uniref:GDP-mannose 4,6-dehydratase n=1 Tax=Sphingobium tyrosinilyticum TaxID=2715436 RepID=A0ABV9F1S2_9SPHN
MTTRCAIITGITGQDGWYLSQLLLRQGYKVIGTTRDLRGADGQTHSGVDVVQWDMKDEAALAALLQTVRPTEIYNFAAYASGAAMYEEPVGIGDINGLAVARILEAIRSTNPSIRFCQASSSELFGEPLESPQCENTAFRPRSPYGAAKLYAHEMVGIYRRRHGLFAVSAILFNHESPRRGSAFVTGKVAEAAAHIKTGLAQELILGNLDARRDWGFSGDYVRAMWLMLQAPTADDYVLATGQSHSVRELCDVAFKRVGLDYRYYVQEGEDAFRPTEIVPLAGDASKARERLRWAPEIDFASMVNMMVDAELERLDQTNDKPR